MRMTVSGILCLLAALPVSCFALRPPDSLLLSTKIAGRYVEAITLRSENTTQKITIQIQKCLTNLQAEEEAILKRVVITDRPEVASIFSANDAIYSKLQTDLNSNAETVTNSFGRYFSGIDSALTSLDFFRKRSGNESLDRANLNKLSQAKTAVTTLEQEINKAANVQEFIKTRQEYLTQALAKYNLSETLANYKKQVYNYSQSIKGLQSDWDDPSRVQSKVIKLLSKIPAYREFLRKNSLVGRLFNIPDDYETEGVGDLQTRIQVEKLFQTQVKIIGPNGAQTAQENISSGQKELSILRDRIKKTGSENAIPEFTPNTKKLKSFLQRFQYGANIQSGKSTYLLPSYSDMAATVAYKATDRSSVGFGVSYKVGWGQPIRHVQLSHQGIGVRSFIDLNVKGSFYSTGGYELNYQPVFRRPDDQIILGGIWQPSGLIGITKIVSLKSAVAKQARAQFLWDFLSYSQFPRTQAFKFRIGYNF